MATDNDHNIYIRRIVIVFVPGTVKSLNREVESQMLQVSSAKPRVMTPQSSVDFPKTHLKTAQNSAKHCKKQVMRAVFALPVIFDDGIPRINVQRADLSICNILALSMHRKSGGSGR